MTKHVDTPGGRTVLTPTEARSAVIEKSGMVLRILTVSLVLAVAVLAVVYLFYFS